MTSATPRILVVDDERSMREFLGIMLTREGYEVVVAESGTQALATLRQRPFDLLISDIRMPDGNGIDVLRDAKRLQPDLPGVLMTAFSSTQTAIEALRTGAIDYVSKPFDVDEMKRVVSQALERRQLRESGLEALATPTDDEAGPRASDTMIGHSPAMQRVFALIEAIASTSSTVLITGESGTGKEMAARAIHRLSPRADRPFVAVNCGALTETLLESELFGHEKGAFTGAMATTRGLVEQAEKGTIFLDELGEMSPMMQVKLLRVLQERRFRRVGGSEELAADIRIIAATNRDLAKMVAEGTFREDLYYRVNVIPVALPPLRERREDLSALARHFIRQFAHDMRRPAADLTAEALAVLEQHTWPGNIRELENVMERAVALEPSGVISPASLPESLTSRDRSHRTSAEGDARSSSDGQARTSRDDEARVFGHGPDESLVTTPHIPAEGFDLERHVQDIEREYLAEALRRADGVKVRAAELLGMSFRSFRYYAKKYNL